MKKILLITVFSSFAIGTYAQCDSVIEATVDMLEDHIYLDPSLLYPTGTTPPDPPGPDTNEVRRIYFIHGLGGTAGAWEKVAEACWYQAVPISNFPKRKCAPIRSDYNNSTGSLASAADGLRTDIHNQAFVDRGDSILDPARAILIAHSQGGLVTRQLMHFDMVKQGIEGTGHHTLTQGMNYGGVVTVASSLQGARILHNRDMIFAMANDACNKLLAGPSYDVGNTLNVKLDADGLGEWVVEKLDLNKTIEYNVQVMLRTMMENIVPPFCKIVTNDVMPMFFKHYYAGITDDYMVGASTIDMLNQDTNNADYRNFPKIAFYAIEPQEHLFWRTLNWMVLKEPNDVAAFQANDDWGLFDDMIEPLYNTYVGRYNGYHVVYEIYSTLWNELALASPARNEYRRKLEFLSKGRDNWRKGLEWFNNANTMWKVIIGAVEMKTITIQIFGGQVEFSIPVEIKEDNDGVVLAESAANLPYASHAPIRIYPNEFSPVDIDKGSSHMQVRNDQGIKEHLNNLFNGDYGRWFKVNENK